MLAEVILTLWFLVSLACGIGLFVIAQAPAAGGAVREVQAFLFLVMATIAFGSAGIIGELRQLGKKIQTAKATEIPTRPGDDLVA